MKKGEFIKSLLNLMGSLFPYASQTTYSTSYFQQASTKELLLLLYAARLILIQPGNGGFPASFKIFFLFHDHVN
jgi:hypothetical protein